MQCTDCDAAVAAELQQRETRRKAQSLDARFRASRLPSIYRDGTRTWSTVAGEAGARAQVMAAVNDTSGLYLYGPAGTHKTSLAAAGLALQIRAGRDGAYVYIPDLFTELAAIYSADDSRSRADVVDRYAHVRCLVLDDLDKAKASRHSAEILGAILDYRYREGLRWLVITANVSRDVLAQRFAADAGEEYAEPLLRRITEMTLGADMVADFCVEVRS